VIRAGVGLFTDLYPGTILDAFTTNFPQVTNFNLPSVAVAFNETGSGASLLAGLQTRHSNPPTIPAAQ